MDPFRVNNSQEKERKGIGGFVPISDEMELDEGWLCR